MQVTQDKCQNYKLSGAIRFISSMGVAIAHRSWDDWLRTADMNLFGYVLLVFVFLITLFGWAIMWNVI